jgi:hypothetical protein
MKVGKAQNVVIASRERETVAGYQTDNRSGNNLIALLCLTDRPIGRTSRGYCSPRSRQERQRASAKAFHRAQLPP